MGELTKNRALTWETVAVVFPCEAVVSLPLTIPQP